MYCQYEHCFKIMTKYNINSHLYYKYLIKIYLENGKSILELSNTHKPMPFLKHNGQILFHSLAKTEALNNFTVTYFKGQ